MALVASSELIVYAPGLLGPYAGQEQWQATDWPTLALLQKLLSRAGRQITDHPSADDYSRLFAFFNHATTGNELPLAALSLLAEGHAPGDDYWMRLDPVCLRADRSDAILIAHDALALTEAEADALQESIRSLQDEWSISLQRTTADHWYIRLPGDMDLRTTPLSQVTGQAVTGRMPQGENYIKWHRFINEVQMTWHGHPINQQREQQGRLMATSVWPWGGGTLPAKTDVNFDRVYTNDLIVQGLASLNNINCQPLEHATQAKVQGRILMVDLSWRQLQQQQDVSGWFEALQRWQATTLQFISQTLEKDKALQVTLDFGGESTYRLSRQHLHRWWRRALTMQQIVLNNS